MWGRARMSFVSSAEGVVCVVETRHRLTWPQVAGPEASVNVAAHDGPSGRSPRYASLSVHVSEDPAAQFTRVLDLSEGSLERQLVEQAVERGKVLCRWQPQGTEAERELDDAVRGRLAEVLASTRGVARDALQADIAGAAERSHWWSVGPATTELAPRVAAPPNPTVPYFAATTGAIPPPGSPAIGGVSLPPGDRCGGPIAGAWATFDEIAQPADLVEPLMQAFPDTGLWPLCWGWRQDEVDVILDAQPASPQEIDAVDVDALVRRCWADRDLDPETVRPFDTAFPGLAESSTAVARRDGLLDGLNDKMGWQDAAGRQILLVPCNRPADALGVLGWQGPEMSGPELCAVLRSWEQRFAAVLVAIDPWSVTLAVGRPPTSIDQALHLAAELAAVSQLEDMYQPDNLQRTAEQLLPPRADSSATVWNEITWRSWRLGVDP